LSLKPELNEEFFFGKSPALWNARFITEAKHFTRPDKFSYHTTALFAYANRVPSLQRVHDLA